MWNVTGSMSSDGNAGRVFGWCGRHLRAICVVGYCLSILTLAGVVWHVMPIGIYVDEQYSRVGLRIESADSTLQDGTFLAVRDEQGRLVSIESVAIDDLGMPLLSNVLAAVRRAPVTMQLQAQANQVVNAAGLILLSLALLQGRMIVTAIVVLLTGAMMEWHATALGLFSPDVLGVQVGAYCLALVLPVFLAIGIRGKLLGRSSEILMFCVGWLCLAASILIRESVGAIGLGFSLLLLICWAFREKPRRALWAAKYCLLMIAVFGTCQVSKGLVAARNALYDIPATSHHTSHGFFHTLYIGLGTEANPWGLAWDDGVAFAAARRVDPNVVYCSDEYFDVLRSLYINLVMEHPREVMRIYKKKSNDSLRSSAVIWLPGRVWHYVLTLPIVAGLCMLLFRKQERVRSGLLLSLVLYGSAILYLSQEVLGFPADWYTPIRFFGIWVTIIVLAEILAGGFVARAAERKRSGVSVPD